MILAADTEVLKKEYASNRVRQLRYSLALTARASVVRLLAVVISLAVVAIIFVLAGYPIDEVAGGMVAGAITMPGAWQSTLRWAMAYAIIGAGVIVALRAGFFNIGAQGQFYIGACAALAVPLYWTDGPPVLVVLTSITAGILGGLLWSLGPGILRVRYGTDEVITTLMASFIAVLVLRALTSGPLQDQSGSGESTASRKIEDVFRLSNGYGVSPWTVSVCLLVLLGTWFLLNRTRFGLLSGLTGRNPLMAKWQGINVARIGLGAFVISGATAGLFGAMEVLGAGGRMSSGFSPGLGFTAILVAVIGGYSITGLVTASLFFGALNSALLYLPVVTDVPPSSLDILRGVVALLVTVSPIALVVVMRRGSRKRGDQA
jgi:simple sugar transport system permease protein